MKTCLITGANAGIGFAAARQMAALGHQIILGCRSVVRGKAAVDAITRHHPSARVDLLCIDMADLQSIAAAASALTAVDVLIHNAASFDISQKQPQVTKQGYETIWSTNVLGPAYLTQLLLPLLQRSRQAVVVAITSKGLMLQPWLAVDLQDTQWQQRRFTVAKAYYQSKLAHLAWMLTLHEQYTSPTLAVHGVRVTNVRIDLQRYPGVGKINRWLYTLKSRFALTPEQMAQVYTWLATTPPPEQACYWDGIGKVAPVSPWATKSANRQALWELLQTQIRAGLAKVQG